MLPGLRQKRNDRATAVVMGIVSVERAGNRDGNRNGNRDGNRVS